jgi:hypothetical protein
MAGSIVTTTLKRLFFLMSPQITKELLPSSDNWRARAALLGLDQKEWFRTPEATVYSSLDNPRLYDLFHKGEIKSFLLKPRPDAVRGVRLWSRSSIDAFFARKYEEALTQGNPVGVVAWAKDKAARGSIQKRK